MSRLSLIPIVPFGRFVALMLPVWLFVLAACQDGTDGPGSEPTAVAKADSLTMGFEEQNIPTSVQFIYASGELSTADGGVTEGKQALTVKFHSKSNENAEVSLVPETPWDWSAFDDFHMAFDISNSGQHSTQIYLVIEDVNGDSYERTVNIPVGPVKTYYAKLAGHDLPKKTAEHSQTEHNFSSGLRSNPPTWESDDIQFTSLWGKKNLDVGGIAKVTLRVKSALHDKQIIVDNIRLRPNPKMNEDFLTNILDEFGQYTRAEYPQKIHSLKELTAQRDAELKQLDGKAMPGRSKFGGWKDGPKLTATGYFRTEKVDGKWALVDPEGYLYISTGLDVIRLSNSSTMTGYDFDPSTIPARDPDDTIAEDDKPLNRVSKAAQKTRFLVSETRAKMFSWLPEYNDELGNHYGYRREAHSGPLEHGETYSFYSANLERKYGETAAESYLDSWQKVSIDRMLNWGFTSLGNWSATSYYDNERIPYVAFGDIIGDFKTVSSGNDFWGAMPDPFDPFFAQRALRTVEDISRKVKGSPWCMGVFIDNELSFGRSENNEVHYGIVINTLTVDGKQSPTKAEFTRLMKAKYKEIGALNKAWVKDIASWEAFDAGIDSSIQTEDQVADYAKLLQAYGSQYFKVVHEAMQKYMPNQLYLSSRFPDWGMPIEIMRAAAQYVDVMTFNVYREGLAPSTWAFLEEIDTPSLVGEFHIGASDAGVVHPGLVHAADQADRAKMYKDYMYSVLDNPYFVGAHWFQYIDSPITGRALDGENYNLGFVAVTDVPYQTMVHAAKEVHSEMYQRRFGSD